jgi:hypothetical protein
MGIFDYYGIGMSHSANSNPYMNAAMTQSKPKQPELRTPEQIQEQLEARYAEMVEEAKRKEKVALTACSICRWSKDVWCRNPLVIGLSERPLTWHWDNRGLDGKNTLCGPEKALWEPTPSRWQRLMEWINRMIDNLEAPLASTDKKA